MSGGFEFLNQLAQWRGEGVFDLNNISKILDFLDNPQDKFPTIHVAGTNGKGSVSVATAAILGAAGFKVGLFSSPHLTKVEERIVFDGAPIANSELDRYLLTIKAAVEKTKVDLSYFEAITVAGFLSFHDAEVNWGVIEVGLGGRLDATNVIKNPVVTAISSIDFDHEAVLGKTIEKIAYEKAGILKFGVPVVVGEIERSAMEVIQSEASYKKCRIYRYGEHFSTKPVNKNHLRLNLEGCSEFEIVPALAGQHQHCNLSVAAQICSTIGVQATAITAGISNVFWPGRLEEGSYNGRKFLLDAAHNPAGVRSLTSYLSQSSRSGVMLAFGVLRSKNWREMLRLLLPFASEICLLAPDSESAVPVEEIEQELSGCEITVQSFGADHERFIRYAFASDKKDEILITGSIYLLGSLRQKMGISYRNLWIKY